RGRRPPAPVHSAATSPYDPSVLQGDCPSASTLPSPDRIVPPIKRYFRYSRRQPAPAHSAATSLYGGSVQCSCCRSASTFQSPDRIVQRSSGSRQDSVDSRLGRQPPAPVHSVATSPYDTSVQRRSCPSGNSVAVWSARGAL